MPAGNFKILMTEDTITPSAIIIAACIFVLLLNTAGAILSRKFKINYGYLAPVSIIFYLFLAYFTALKFGFGMAILANAITGAFDGTICWRIVKKLKPELGAHYDQMMEIPENFVAVYTVVIVVIIAVAGALFA